MINLESRKIKSSNTLKKESRRKKKEKFFKNSLRLNRILSGEEKMDYYTEEAFNQLRTNITFSFTDDGSTRIIGITSSMRGEGKSFVSCCIANSIAKTGKRVLLIDADLRLPTVAKKLKLQNNVGLSNLLTDSKVSTAETINRGAFGGVDVLTSGTIPPNPSELLESERMKQLLASYSEVFDYIVIDLPPVTAVTDALIVSRYIDGLIIVTRHEHTDRTALSETIRQLRLAGARMLGFVYNGKYLSGGAYTNKYYKYKYRYGYKYRYRYSYRYGDKYGQEP